MRGWWAMLVALAVAVVLAIVATTPPAPAPADAPAGAFSAMRAMRDVRAIARAPHPTGSAENERVRGYLIARLRAIGLETVPLPSRLSAKGKAVLDRWRGTPAPAPTVTSILATLPGRDRTAPAVLLMAHFDTVWGSPGAADDAGGVAAAIEVARAVRAAGVPGRDLMLLLTDGEEPGLEGARAFFGGHPARARVGVVINLEARGGGGRAAMFETGRGNDAAMRSFGRAVGGPVATSLSALVYQSLPNSTDFTPARQGGWPGYNFAFIGRAAYYHSPLSTPDIVDTGAVQDMGGQALDLTRALLAAPSLPRRSAGDRTFFDAYGLWLVQYPPAVGWVLLLLGVAGYAAAARRDPGAVARGAGAIVALAVVAAILLFALNLLSGADGRVNYYDRLAAIPRLQAQALLACGAALGATAGLFLRRGVSAGFVAGMAAPVAVLAVVVQAVAPTASYVLVVPLLLGGVAAGVRWRAAAIVAAALVTGYLLGFGFFLMQAVGPKTPIAAVLPLLPVALVLAPLAGRIARRRALAVAAVLLVLGAGVALWVRADPLAPSVPPYSNHK
ncbi:hypothetical protein ASG29_13035 [Sphingomonas sp. Leaf412]|uniref:M20/M25/M40 family metallo-hydrolase n=1 Tax=Sphingomonas sp. Leaf412 TaxID=1736370 RepID=UPI000701C483|nr:M20/M25/M40 family metallo-hydrolase [Sphingomonas sp. Leaf412]KQT32657.1 hypothetical protein ASG29_13035 [Sphingomonas sp. Leaf412]